jgi:hypothetical protein
MNLRQRVYQPWSAEATLGTGDATKTVKAAPGAGKRIVVTGYTWSVLVSAAQAVDVEDSSGTVHVLRLPASPGVVQGSYTFEAGLELTVNEALVITPAAAGPSVHVVAEGYIKPSS